MPHHLCLLLTATYAQCQCFVWDVYLSFLVTLATSTTMNVTAGLLCVHGVKAAHIIYDDCYCSCSYSRIAITVSHIITLHGYDYSN